jgi:hypothetical protein
MTRAEIGAALKEALWARLSCCGCGCCCYGEEHEEAAKELIHLADDHKLFSLTPDERDELKDRHGVGE